MISRRPTERRLASLFRCELLRILAAVSREQSIRWEKRLGLKQGPSPPSSDAGEEDCRGRAIQTHLIHRIYPKLSSVQRIYSWANHLAGQNAMAFRLWLRCVRYTANEPAQKKSHDSQRPVLPLRVGDEELPEKQGLESTHD